MSGFLVLLSGNLINLAVLPYADLVMFSTLSCLVLIFNAILSNYILKELFTRYDFVAVLLITTGSILVVMQTHVSDTMITNDMITDTLISLRPLCILFFYVLFIVTAIRFDRFVERKIDNFYKDVMRLRSTHNIMISFHDSLNSPRLDESHFVEEQIMN